jgi:predicted Zn-dependent peptidase
MSNLSSASIALAFLAATVQAQGVDRSKRPVVEPAPPLRIPTVVSQRLPNGIELRVVEDHSVPVVAVRVVLGADSTLDPPGKEGLFAVTMGATREATTTLTADGLAAAAADIGTTITPTSFTTTVGSFPAALSIMGEMLTAPSFDSAVVERRKAVQMAAARRVAQTPSSPPRHLFYQLLYGAADPYTRSLIPTEASVRSITRDDVRAFYDQFISPRVTTLVIAGDVTPAVALAEARRVFGKWEGKPGSVGAGERQSSLAHEAPVIHLIDVPAQQSYVYVGFAGPRRSAADAAAAELLGAVATTRMQQELRDKRALMYAGTIGLTWRRPTQPSAFVGSAVVDPRNVDSVLVSWLGLLRALRDTQPPVPAEVDAGRRARIGSLPARFDGPDSVAARLVELVRDGLSPEYFNDWATRLGSMPIAEVAAAARRVIDTDHVIVVVSGDRRVIEPALRAANLGPIVVVDADGRQKP